MTEPDPGPTRQDPADALAAVAAATAAATAAADAADAAAEAAADAADAADAAAEAAGAAADAAATAADDADAAAAEAVAAAAVAEATLESSDVAAHHGEESAPGPSRPARHLASGVVAVAAVEVLLLALGWLALSVVPGGGPADRPTDVARVTGPSPTVAGTQASRPGTTRAASPRIGRTLAACRRVAERQDQALGAAAVTLDDWQIHLGAMNKFAAGVVTLDELDGFWDQTAVPAAGGVSAFRASARDLGRHPGDCPPPGKRMRTAALRGCAEDVGSRRRALHAARVAADEWDQQQQDMRSLRSGQLSSAAARSDWPRTARTSVGVLQDYRRAARAVPDRAACAT